MHKKVSGTIVDFDTGEEDLDVKVDPRDRLVCSADGIPLTFPVPGSPPQDRPNLEDLAARMCADHGVSIEESRSKSQRRDLTPIRLELAERAMKQRIARHSDVARYLRRDPSTLSKQMSRYRRKVQ